MGLFGGSKKRDDGRDHELFDVAYKTTSGSVQVLLRSVDLFPVYISSNFQTVFGVEPERVADDVETLLRFVPEVDRAKYRREVREWDRTNPLVTKLDFERPNSANPPMRIRLTIESVMGGSYELVEMVDMSAERDAYNELAIERDAALETAENRTDFLNQMSHEIRTPLNGIKGMITLARDHRADESRLLDDLARADELSSYLLTLVNDVLDMGRLSNGRVELESLPFDMRLVAGEIRSMFEKQAADKGIDYVVETLDCESVYLLGDRMRLNQVIVNFISNALKFTDEGGKVTLTFREMYRHGDEVNYMIRVRDTGKGMDPRFISRIFKPFEQEDRTIARRYGGTGLGMPIAGALVELMGGEVVVDTELGRGSDFAAYIPFEVASPKQVEDMRAHGETFETKPDADARDIDYDFNGKRFLMAEDNAINSMIAEEVLAKLGAKVEIADDGPIVVDRFAASKPGYYDAILMDIQMPTLSGWEATELIRALDRADAKTVPIIALSANNYAEDARKSRAAGMNGHAGKPLDYVELKAQLAAAVAESTLKGARS